MHAAAGGGGGGGGGGVVKDRRPLIPPIHPRQTNERPASVVELVCSWCRLAAVRLRLALDAAPDGHNNHDDERQVGSRLLRWAATEALIAMGSVLWYELLSLAAFNFLRGLLARTLPVSAAFDVLTNARIYRIYTNLWYVGVFARIIVGPLLPKPRLTKHIRALHSLQPLPSAAAILLDPRIEMLHSFSSLEVRLLSRGCSAIKRRLILLLLVPWRGRPAGAGGGEGAGAGAAEGVEEIPTPRAPRAGEGGAEGGGVPAH